MRFDDHSRFTLAHISPLQAHRGVPLSHTYLSTPASTHTAARITLVYSLPLSSIITNFHSTLKSLTSGFASFDYEEGPYERGDLCRMNILVNSVKVDALCSVLHRSAVQKEGRDWAKRLREVVPRQQYEVSRVSLSRFLHDHTNVTLISTGRHPGRCWVLHHRQGTVRRSFRYSTRCSDLLHDPQSRAHEEGCHC